MKAKLEYIDYLGVAGMCKGRMRKCTYLNDDAVFDSLHGCSAIQSRPSR
jgi:hypothetical protein